jgi:ABC-2 type transport system permease protein
MAVLERGRGVVARRSVLRLLVVRDLKVRYAGSFLGYAWSVLDPLLMAGVYWFVFGVVFDRGEVGHEPYIVFLVSGLLPWQWFSASLTDSSRALKQESKLIRSTSLPREIWVLRVVGAKGVEFLLSLPVLVLFMVAYGMAPHWQLVLLPLAVLLQTMLLTGLGLLLSPLTVLAPDLQRVVRIILRVAFYLSPVLYAYTRVPDHHFLREIYALNPMTGILELYRAFLFPDEFAGWGVVGAAVVVCAAVFAGGMWVFQRLESAVLKEI